MSNNLKDLSTYFNEMYGGSVWPVPVQIKRGNGLPLDQSTIFQTLSDAQDYAAGNSISTYSPDGTLLVQQAAYRGQFIAVVPISGDAETSAFVVNEKGELTHLASAKNEGELYEKLHKEIGDLSSDAYSDLSINVELCATAEGDAAKTYVVTQGGKKIGASINIPKDKVIDSAYLVQVSAEVMPEPISGYNVIYYDDHYNKTYVCSTDILLSDAFWSITNAWHGYGGGDGPYIRLSVQNDPVPIYIAAPKLVDSYVGANTDTISVEVGGGTDTTHYISASVIENSISQKHLTPSLSDEIKNVVHIRGVGDFDATLSNNATWAETSATLSVIPWYTTHTAILGDLVIKTSTESEFIFTDTGIWKEFGSGSKIHDIEISVSNLCVALETETERATNIENKISCKVDNKVKVGTGIWDEEGLSATYDISNKTSLSVVKMSDEDYYKLVASEKYDPDVVYIVSSDYVNGHDQRIINVGTPISATDAVNLSTLTTISSYLEQRDILSIELNGQSFDIGDNHKAELNISCIYCGNADE